MADGDDVVARLLRLSKRAEMVKTYMSAKGVSELALEARSEIVDLRAKLSRGEEPEVDEATQKRWLKDFSAAYAEQLESAHTRASLFHLHITLIENGVTASHRQYWKRMWERMGGRLEEADGHA